MQGFFGKPVDNLFAEPLIARWIRHQVPDWQEAVVVSKNPGGTKRVTSLADALKLNFGIVTTDRRRNLGSSSMLDGRSDASRHGEGDQPHRSKHHHHASHAEKEKTLPNGDDRSNAKHTSSASQPSRLDTTSQPRPGEDDEYNDERARDVITGRLVHGQLVDDDYPSPTLSPSMSNSNATLPSEKLRRSSLEDSIPDAMTNSVVSASSFFAGNSEVGPNGAADATAADSEEEEEGEGEGKVPTYPIEKTITLVGNVKDRIVLIVDDMIDKPGTWIAAAETAVKRGGAKKVYCIATHGLFGNDCLEDMERCDCIDHVWRHGLYESNPTNRPPGCGYQLVSHSSGKVSRHEEACGPGSLHSAFGGNQEESLWYDRARNSNSDADFSLGESVSRIFQNYYD